MSVKRGREREGGERERVTDRWVCIVVSKCEVCARARSMLCATHQLYWDLRERKRERYRGRMHLCTLWLAFRYKREKKKDSLDWRKIESFLLWVKLLFKWGYHARAEIANYVTCEL